MNCIHPHEVKCSYISPTLKERLEFLLCEKCAEAMWKRMSYVLQETYSIEAISE